jgi:hypothetical protein
MVGMLVRLHDAHDEKAIATKYPELHGANFKHAMFVVPERMMFRTGFLRFGGGF